MEKEQNFGLIIKWGAIMALIVVSLIPVQIFVFSAWPPPDTVEGFFDLLNRNWFLGLLSLDLIYLLNNILLAFVYLALYFTLRKANHSLMIIALVPGFIGIAVYYASSVAFEMLSLSNQFALADSPDLKSQLLASGRMMIEIYKGTAFDIYYVLNAFTLLLISYVMLKSDIFSKTTAIWGLASGVLMIIPSTAGTIGLVFSLLSLIPWIVFSILIARRLLILSR